jgi:hypothetical protein
VHPCLPLQADDRTFGRLEQKKRTEQSQRQPYDELKPYRRRISYLNREDRRDDGVTDHDDHEIGWEIVSSVVMKFLAALVTAVGDLQETPE